MNIDATDVLFFIFIAGFLGIVAFEYWKAKRVVKYFIHFKVMKKVKGKEEMEEHEGTAEVVTSAPITGIERLKKIEEDIAESENAEKAIILYWRRYD